MTGQTVRLVGDTQRQLAKRLIDQAPHAAIVNIKPESRNSEQNAKLWAMLSDIARAKPEGRELTTDAWKCLFMQAAGFSFHWEPGIDGRGVVPCGFKSSRLTKAEFADLITCVQEYGDRHGVQWSDPGVYSERRVA